MKKSNVIIVVLLLVISIFLLWLWYFLGFNRIDSPLDLVLSIIWWLVVIVTIVAVTKIESKRRHRIRTLFIGVQGATPKLFNSEAGELVFTDRTQLISIMENTLDELKYNFERKDYPGTEEDNRTRTEVQRIGSVDRKYEVYAVVMTRKHTKDEWEGEVIDTKTKVHTEFEDKESLVSLLAAMNLHSVPVS